jgi:hypothetical protein
MSPHEAREERASIRESCQLIGEARTVIRDCQAVIAHLRERVGQSRRRLAEAGYIVRPDTPPRGGQDS